MSFFTTFFFQYGLTAIFLLILLEYACFPVSSEIVLPLAGAVAATRNLSFFLILPVSVVAGLLGTTICFAIGRFGGQKLLNKLQEKFPASRKGIESSFAKFEKHGSKAVCFGRVIPICRTYIAFVAGALKQPYPVFLFSSFIGITVWNTILMGLGYYLKANWKIVQSYYEKYSHIFLLVLLLFLLLFFLYTALKKSRQKA
ncbi:DedA family protein [Anaerolentibacter hominis]|uniref:DedA family protein n=1 Tax=Anaerolentibacter hominis TaxID=3079009 RepID=UPI0031B7EC94